MRFRQLFIAAAGMALPGAALAQPVTGPYVSLGGGVDFLQNELVKPYRGFGVSRRSYAFDPGPAAAASVGYGLGNGLRLEIEGDYANNHVSGVKLATPERAGGHQQQFGGFFNALYDFDLDLGLQVAPYVGAGAGYQEIELDGISSGLAGQRLIATGSKHRGSFAYQGIAGLSVPVAFVPGLSLTAEYRFIGVSTPPAFRRGSGSGNTLNGVPLVSRNTFSNIFNHEILVGLRYAFDVPPPAVVTAALPAVTMVQAAARTYLVFFDWNRAELTGRARQIIADAARPSNHFETTRMVVNGYTDLSGTAAANQRLSVRRAQAVAGELVRDGVSRDAISTQGLGESNPLVPTAAGVREPQNRRVEIILR